MSYVATVGLGGSTLLPSAAEGSGGRSVPAYTRPATPQTGGDIYVDAAASGGGAGTSGDPYTWAEMVSNLSAGVTAHCRGAFGNVNIDFDASTIAGTATEWIVIKQWAGQTQASITATGGSQSLRFDASAEYIAIEGLDIQHTNLLENILITNGAQHIHIVDCTLFAQRTTDSSWSNALAITSGASGTVNDIWIDGNTITQGSAGNRTENAGDGIYVATNSGGTLADITIVRNSIGDCAHAGIDLDRPSGSLKSEGITIALNLITNTFCSAVVVAGADGALIEHNRFSDSATAAGAETNANSHEGLILGGDNCTVRYNRIWDCHGAGIQLQANYFNSLLQTCTGNNIYGNTIVNCGGSFIMVSQNASTNPKTDLANNIVTNNLMWSCHEPEDATQYDVGSGDRSAYFNGNYQRIYIDIANSSHSADEWADDNLYGNVFQNNWFARDASNSDNWCMVIRSAGAGGNKYYTKAQFEALNSSANNTDVGDPSLTNVGTDDFTLQGGSSCIDAGTVISGQDYLGSAPDIGWDEAA